ncbi:MAG TPA: hemerythrin domain-containing protein [Acidothermaceae bacterium]
MGDANGDREKAAKLPEGDLVRILLTQHATVKDTIDQVEKSSGAKRAQLFEQLTTMLMAHETAEESVVRPVTKETAGEGVSDARNAEESEANEVIAALSELDVDSPEFDEQFAEFKQAVSDHAEAEEAQEFPTIQSGRSAAERQALGAEFLEQFEAAGGTVS